MSLVVAACLTWADQRPLVDPLTGSVDADPRSSRMSYADQAALEWALCTAQRWGGEVLAVTAGPAAADDAVRHARASGASRVVRVGLTAEAPSEHVAAALADVLDDARAHLVWCGDHSVDRGSGSVPAYLAAHLGVAQALGLVGVELGLTAADGVTAVRRLDGARRERLVVPGRAVLSVEGSTARLRRAPLAAALRAGAEPVEVMAAVSGGSAPRVTTMSRPYRPRARVLPAPTGGTALDRIAALTHAAGGEAPAEVVTLEPGAAADRILQVLAERGFPPRP